MGVPVLAICYGMQLVCEALGGKVEPSPSREFGRAECRVRFDQQARVPEGRLNVCAESEDRWSLGQVFNPGRSAAQAHEPI